MKPTYSIERVTPQKAWEWLTTSTGNRNFKPELISMLMGMMARGEWTINNNSITFDSNGVLIDGHNRLYSLVVANLTVEMGILRGVPPKAKDTIDTTPGRTMADHLRLNHIDNSTTRSAYLTTCARIIAGSTVPIKAMETYNLWEPLFRVGTKAYFESSCTNSQYKYLRSAKVASPLIVAHKANPDAMELFFTALREGANLSVNNPALKLREFLLQELNGHGIRKMTQDMVISKVFSMAKAFLDERPISKVMPSDGAVQYFRSFYSRGNAGEIAKNFRTDRNEVRIMTGTVDCDPNKGGLSVNGVLVRDAEMTLEEFRNSFKAA